MVPDCNQRRLEAAKEVWGGGGVGGGGGGGGGGGSVLGSVFQMVYPRQWVSNNPQLLWPLSSGKILLLALTYSLGCSLKAL